MLYEEEQSVVPTISWGQVPFPFMSGIYKISLNYLEFPHLHFHLSLECHVYVLDQSQMRPGMIFFGRAYGFEGHEHEW